MKCPARKFYPKKLSYTPDVLQGADIFSQPWTLFVFLSPIDTQKGNKFKHGQPVVNGNYTPQLFTVRLIAERPYFQETI